MMDRIDAWRLFLAVATLGSFAKAARAHGRSPQAVTRAIASLETRMGTRLLHRTTRSVSLTGDGERHLEQCRRALAELDALESKSSSPSALSGTLSVTAPVLFGQRHVVPIVTHFLVRYPDVDVRLLLLDRVVSLAEEGIDVGVRVGALPDSSLRARVVGHVRSVVCASPAYLKKAGVPRTPEELGAHACIGFSGTTPIADRWSFRFEGGRARRERSVAVRARLTVNTGQAAIDAALAGVGIVRVLSYQVDQLLARGELQEVLAKLAPEPVPVQLVQLPGVQTRAALAFGEHAFARLQKSLGSRSKRARAEKFA